MRAVIRMACAGAVVIALPLTAATAATDHSASLRPVVENLDGARGVAVDAQGRVVVSQANGSISKVVPRRGRTGKIIELGSVPGSFIAPAIDVGPRGHLFALTPQGEPGTGAATLLRQGPGRKAAEVLADIGAYQAEDLDPDDLEELPEESNPYDVAALDDGSVLVADAAGNDLLRVRPNGDITTVARFKPRVIPFPEGLPEEIEGQPLPPAGTPMPAESVPTSVAVGPDGAYYVGELRGFPATPGTSMVWRIRPGAVDAVCDPSRPRSGDCQVYADGFTSITDLAVDDQGRVHVLELVQQSWLQWEWGLADPVGGLFRIPRGGGEPTELAAGELMLPGGVATDGDRVYVTGPIFGPGGITTVK